jgi:hypothetical protein
VDAVKGPTLLSTGKGDVPANVPVNVSLSERQQWFLDQLREGIHCGSAEIATRWDVVLKTAKRDIADLQKKDLITFVGPAKKTPHIPISLP